METTKEKEYPLSFNVGRCSVCLKEQSQTLSFKAGNKS
jgi:hypothetical protein